MSSPQPHTETGAVARLLAGYRRLPGVSDELLDAAGKVRPAWRAFIDHVARMAPEEISRRIEQGDQYLRDAGVFFRQLWRRPDRARVAAEPYAGDRSRERMDQDHRWANPAGGAYGKHRR